MSSDSVGGELDSRWSDEGFELTYCKDGVAIFECDEYVFEATLVTCLSAVIP